MEALFELDLKSISESPGIYMVYWVRNGESVEINRILDVDRKGILYIGATRRRGLRSRLRDLRISIEMAKGIRKRKKFPHTFGSSLVYTGLVNRIEKEELYVYFKTYNKPEEAEDQEKLALLYYTRRYGEPPPLNLQVSRKYYIILGLGELGVSKLTRKIDPDLKCALGL